LIEINVDELVKIEDIRSNLRFAQIPEKDVIDRIMLHLQKFFIKPFMPIRDVSLFDTMIYFSESGAIISGGYGINICFFEPDERRLSLADLDVVLPTDMDIDNFVEKVNHEIIRNRGAILIRGERNEVIIGLLTYNVKKMQWLRRIGAEDVYSLNRTIIIPQVGNYSLRGEPLIDYLKRKNFSNERTWRLIVKNARETNLLKYRVETIEIDITIMDVDSILKKPNTAFEFFGLNNYVKYDGMIKVISPDTAVTSLINALRFFYKKGFTHNTVKTLLDLRLAKLVGRQNEIRDIIEKIISQPQYSYEYERGKEAWRFAILRMKYPKLINLVRKWFF